MISLISFSFAANYQYTNSKAANYVSPPPVPSPYQFVEPSKPNYIELPATPTPYQYTEPAKPYYKELPATAYQYTDSAKPLYKAPQKDNSYKAPNSGYQTDGYSASSSVVTGLVSIAGAFIFQ